MSERILILPFISICYGNERNHIMTGEEILIYGALILGVGGNIVFAIIYIRDKLKAKKDECRLNRL